MKKAMFILAAILAFSTAANCQKVETDSKGNYYAVKDTANAGIGNAKPTGKTFTDLKGNVYPVYVSERGKLFVVRTSQKTGNKYKQYLKP